MTTHAPTEPDSDPPTPTHTGGTPVGGSPAEGELAWEPPGPGSWTLLADHYPRPVTATAASLVDVWSEATTTYLRDLGLPITSARMATVNGLPYLSFETPGGGGSSAPPAWLMRLMARVSPSLRRSERRLRAVLAARPWIAGIARWYEHDRAAAIGRMRALASVDPDALTAVEMADHLEEVGDEVHRSMHQHLSLHAHDILPPGLFVVAARRWGIDVDTAFELLAGASPASTGASPELDRLREAIARRIDGETRAGRPGGSTDLGGLDDLRALGPEVAAALDELLELHGWRIIDGYDVDSICLIESPELLVRLATAPAPVPVDTGARARAARDMVPLADRVEFDRLLADGRRAYGLRDDNGGILVAWPAGTLRRALLAAGRRLAADGVLDDPGLAIEATPHEIARVLRHGTGLDVAELDERRRARQRVRAADAPPTLGPPEPPMPVGLGGALGTVFEVLELVEPGDTATAPELTGDGMGEQPYTGTARLVVGADPTAVAAFEPGDVLVAPMTSPSYNLLLSLAGAVVTEAGGPMSHAAIMARELGLAAVLGVARATSLIADGDTVTVDPRHGTVRVVEPAASGATMGG